MVLSFFPIVGMSRGKIFNRLKAEELQFLHCIQLMRYISDTRFMRTILYGAFISKIGHHISVLLVNLDFTMPIKLHSRTVAAGIRTSNLPRAKDFKKLIQRRVLFSKEKLNLQQMYTILYCPVLKKNKSFINKHLCYQNYYSIPVTCRYMAEILHKRRKTLFNLSINQLIILQSCVRTTRKIH